jgi:hypothetical protein
MYIGKLWNIRCILMFLGRTKSPRNITDYVPWPGEGTKEHKADIYVPQPWGRPEEHKLPHPVLSSFITLSSAFGLRLPDAPVCPSPGYASQAPARIHHSPLQ